MVGRLVEVDGVDASRRDEVLSIIRKRESAEEAERQFGPKREEIVRELGGTVRSTDLYDAPIVERLAGVRA